MRLRIANHRIQMRAGEGCFIVAEGTVVPNHSCVVQVRITNALEHCERARLAGAQILSEPIDHVYGERQYNAGGFLRTQVGFHGIHSGCCARKLGRHVSEPITNPPLLSRLRFAVE